MSQIQTEAFKKLRLDVGFFQQFLRRECINLKGAAEQDFDIYLMETGVMAVLLQGLDALSKHVDKISQKAEFCGGPSGGDRPSFNPLVWLAQYLLRNHPAHVKDHRTPMYQRFNQLANVERGRRILLRKRDEIEAAWMEEERGRLSLSHEDILSLIRHLDEKWDLQGAFIQCMSQDLVRGLCQQAGGRAAFVDFWAWFERFVLENDVLPASAFDMAEERLQQGQLKAQRAQEEQKERERVKQEVLEVRQSLTEQFEAVSADMYLNETISKIINDGAMLSCELKEASVPSKGEHTALILALLRLWGFPVEAEETPEPSQKPASEGLASEETSQEEQPLEPLEPESVEDKAQVDSRRASSEQGEKRQDVWNSAAQDAWQCWSQMHGKGGLQVESDSLRALMDSPAFQEHLHLVHPLRPLSEAQPVVEILTLASDDASKMIVEALDEHSGETLELVVPDVLVAEMRWRLDQRVGDSTMRVHAHFDVISHCITELLRLDARGGSSTLPVM